MLYFYSFRGQMSSIDGVIFYNYFLWDHIIIESHNTSYFMRILSLIRFKHNFLDKKDLVIEKQKQVQRFAQNQLNFTQVHEV